MKELVILKNKQAVTTSRNIASNFDKNHQHILEAVDKLTVENSTVKNMFEETTYKNNRGREYREVLMNRDGFTLLAMSFTGKKALEFKLKYIEAFNQMEARLTNQVPTNMVEAITLALEQAKTIEVQNQVIGELQPKADYTDKILQSKSLFTITQIAKDYGMSGSALNKKLHELGVQYKQAGQWLLYSQHHAKGYTHSETFEIEGNRVVMNTKWTQKGRLFLYKLLKENEILPTIEK